jgi:serine protease
MLYLNSAGNGSSSNPARQAFEQPLLVASTTDTDSISDFSNVGTGIDISAPGSDILSTIRYGDYDFFS